MGIRERIGIVASKLRQLSRVPRYIGMAVTQDRDTAEVYLSWLDDFSDGTRFGEVIGDYYMQMEEKGSAIDTGALARAHFDNARHFWSVGRIGPAMSNLAAAISLCPSAPYYVERGDRYRDLGNRSAALADYKRALELDPENWSGLDGIYQCHRAAGTLEQALAFYLELSMREGSALHMYSVGRTHCGLGEFETAVARLSEAIKLDRRVPVEWPAIHNPYLLRADAHCKLGDYCAAVSDYGAGLEISEGDAGTFMDWGIAYQRTGDFERAIENLERAIELDPDLTDAHINLIDTYSSIGDHGRATGALDRLLAMRPELQYKFTVRKEARRGIERLARQSGHSGGRPRWAVLPPHVDAVWMAGATLAMVALALHAVVTSVVTLPPALALLGDLELPVPAPAVWAALAAAPVAAALGVDRGLSLCKAKFGRTE